MPVHCNKQSSNIQFNLNRETKGIATSILIFPFGFVTNFSNCHRIFDERMLNNITTPHLFTNYKKKILVLPVCLSTQQSKVHIHCGTFNAVHFII